MSQAHDRLDHSAEDSPALSPRKRGRPPQCSTLVDGVECSEHAKQRLRVILDTLAGAMTIGQACGVLEMSESRFHALRNQYLRDSAATLEPRNPGPAPKSAAERASQAEVERLRREIEDLRFKVYAARVREELALVMPERVRRHTVVGKQSVGPLEKKLGGAAARGDETQRRSAARRHAVALTRLGSRFGCRVARVASTLGIAVSTLRDWIARRLGKVTDPASPGAMQGAPIQRTLGRPRRPVSLEDCMGVEELLDQHGGRVSMASLRGVCRMPRARLRSLVHLWRMEHPVIAQQLIWTRPGIAWVMDWTELDEPIELPGVGFTRRVLLVRDLASSMLLLAAADPVASALLAAQALATLFAMHPAPLVLKTDNGSNVVGGDIPQILKDSGVAHLRSPARTPRYNGSIEASIGWLKTRLREIHVACRNRRPLRIEDLQKALLEGNALARPWGARGPTPDQAWLSRRPIRIATREAFAHLLDRHLVIEALALLAPDVANPLRPKLLGDRASDCILPLLGANQRAKVARRAIRQTLEAFGFLITRRIALSST